MKTNLKTVLVKFENEKYNYKTSVNANSSEESLRRYFVGASFDMGCYPIENMQVCIDIEIS